MNGKTIEFVTIVETTNGNHSPHLLTLAQSQIPSCTHLTPVHIARASVSAKQKQTVM